jgi:hypothetical protein
MGREHRRRLCTPVLISPSKVPSFPQGNATIRCLETECLTRRLVRHMIETECMSQ